MIDAVIALAAYGALVTVAVWIVGRSLSARIDELQAEVATWRRLAQQEHDAHQTSLQINDRMLAESDATIRYLEARLRDATRKALGREGAS